MGRSGITYFQVVKAAKTLLEQGVNPTIETVRSYLKTGSYSTIAPLLKRWKEEVDTENYSTMTSAKDMLPVELLQSVKGLWEQLQAKSNEKLEETISKYSEKLKKLDEQLEEKQKNIAKLVENNEHLTQSVSDLGCIERKQEKEIVNLNKKIVEKSAELDKKQVIIKENANRINDLKQAILKMEDNIEHFREESRKLREEDNLRQNEEKNLLKEEISKANLKNIELEGIIVDCRAKIKTLLNEKENMQESYKELKYDHKQLTKDYHSIEKELNNLSLNNKNTEKKLIKTEKELANKVNELNNLETLLELEQDTKLQLKYKLESQEKENKNLIDIHEILKKIESNKINS